MNDFMSQVWEMLVGREHGPLSFRLIIQPLVATALAVRAGLRDARGGRSPFAWLVLTHPDARREGLRSAWQDIGKLYLTAIAIDLAYELIVSRRLYPLQSVVVATILAVPPYLLVRGIVDRMARRYRRDGEPPASGS